MGEPTPIRKPCEVGSSGIRLNVGAHDSNELPQKSHVVREIVTVILPVGCIETGIEESVRVDHSKSDLIGFAAQPAAAFEAQAAVTGTVQGDDECADSRLKSNG